MGHIFISYAREDRDVVSRLREALEQKGFNVWLDDRLMAGAHYDDAIEQALEDADKVIVAWSPAASASQWVRAEAGEGLERGIIVPILIRPTKIPLEFRRIQTVDLTVWNGEPASANLDHLLVALGDQASTGKSRSARADSKPTAARDPAVSAEMVSASRLLMHFKIRLRIARKTFNISHVNWIIFQTLKVNGIVVARSYGLKLQDHFSFAIEAATKHDASLFITGEATSGLTAVSLEVDDHEVLRQPIRWSDGAVGLFGYTLFGLIFPIGLIEINPDLVSNFSIWMVAYTVYFAMLTYVYFKLVD